MVIYDLSSYSFDDNECIISTDVNRTNIQHSQKFHNRVQSSSHDKTSPHGNKATFHINNGFNGLSQCGITVAGTLNAQKNGYFSL